MRILTMAVSALALAACSGETDAPAPAPAETPVPVEPGGGIGDGAGPPPTPEALSAKAIPARFQGAWDYEGGTCNPASDLRMAISGKEILFYESIGQVTGVQAEGGDIVVSLDMEGEGQTWQQKTRFSIVGNGDMARLHSSDGDSPKQRDEYPAKRCPA